MKHASGIDSPNRLRDKATASCVHPALVSLMVLASGLPEAAHAVDGCLVLLCLAAPSWSAVAQCVDPVRQLFRDLARGRPFPSCAMAGGGNAAGNRWAAAPGFCPPQYTYATEGESAVRYECAYIGAVEVTVDGAPFSRTWWTVGDSVTEFSEKAKAILGQWDTRFEDDYARWLASQPPAPTEQGY